MYIKNISNVEYLVNISIYFEDPLFNPESDKKIRNCKPHKFKQNQSTQTEGSFINILLTIFLSEY